MMAIGSYNYITESTESERANEGERERERDYEHLYLERAGFTQG
jgi:hypothetical protein